MWGSINSASHVKYAILFSTFFTEKQHYSKREILHKLTEVVRNIALYFQRKQHQHTVTTRTYLTILRSVTNYSTP